MGEEMNSVSYNNTTNTFTFYNLRVNFMKSEYEFIKKYIRSMIHFETTPTFDMTELVTINSSGLTLVSRMIIEFELQKQPGIRFIIKKNMEWQEKMLRNIFKIWNNIEVVEV